MFHLLKVQNVLKNIIVFHSNILLPHPLTLPIPHQSSEIFQTDVFIYFFFKFLKCCIYLFIF